MFNYYDYGPDFDFNITFTGDMEKYNGSYENIDDKSKYLVQSLCHALYEIKDEIHNSEKGQLWFNDNNWIQHLHTYKGENYGLYTYDFMTAFVITQTDENDFDVDFLSPNQLLKCDSFLDYAAEHKVKTKRYKR